MSRLIYIVGESGSGKSTSLRNFNPKETLIINPDANDLPFRGFGKLYNTQNKNYVATSDPDLIINVLKSTTERTEIKRVVIDTWTRTMTDYIMSAKFRKTSGFDKWGEFAAIQYDLINIINNTLRKDLIVYLLAHPEKYFNETGLLSARIAVNGQQLKKFVPESFSSVVLYTEVKTMPGKAPEFYFRTVNNGADTCKSPMDMFDQQLIPNDLVEVENKIREYYE